MLISLIVLLLCIYQVIRFYILYIFTIKLVFQISYSKNSQRCNVLFICQVAAYEFSFQVRINSFEASELYTQRHLSKSAVTPKATPLIRPCYVQATGM